MATPGQQWRQTEYAGKDHNILEDLRALPPDELRAASFALRHGELFFRRVWWTGNRTTDGGKTELNQTAGVPTFNPDAFDGQQYQYAAPRFRVAHHRPPAGFFTRACVSSLLDLQA